MVNMCIVIRKQPEPESLMSNIDDLPRLSTRHVKWTSILHRQSFSDTINIDRIPIALADLKA
jgi:hypothetical protein